MRRATLPTGHSSDTLVLTVVELSPSAPPPYTSLPAPCSVISLAALATYLPNPTGTPLSVPSASTYKEADCEWSSTAGGEDRKVVSDVVIFRSSNGSPDATDAARQFYSSSLSALGCHCPATAVSVRSVPGLGDQATALVVTADPDAVEITPSGGVIPGLTLLVTSRNAGIELNYRSAVAATGAALPADAGKLTGIIAMARGILAELGGRAAASAAPATAEPHYAGPRDPCRPIKSATLVRYAPGATVSPGITSSGAPQSPNGSPNPDGSRTTTCSWDSGGNGLVSVSLNLFPDAVRAQQGFDIDAHALSQGTSGITVTGDQWLTDLGEDGAVIYQTHSTQHSVQILVHAGQVCTRRQYRPGPGRHRRAVSGKQLRLGGAGRNPLPGRHDLLRRRRSAGRVPVRHAGRPAEPERDQVQRVATGQGSGRPGHRHIRDLTGISRGGPVRVVE